MRWRNLVEAESNCMMGIFERLPVNLVEGRGVRVFDDTGREYLDLVTEVATNTLGHCHPMYRPRVRCSQSSSVETR
jgi:acetylornithine/N-succinyldiaminopimelate aminotransferase